MTRQNIYDQQLFFDCYQQLRAQDSGINATVEQPALRARLPALAGSVATRASSMATARRAAGTRPGSWPASASTTAG